MAKKYMGVITLQNLMNIIKTELGKKVNVADIINDLTTGGADKVLSAEQGKALKDLLDGIVGEEGGVENAQNADKLGGKDASAYVLVENVLSALEAITQTEAVLTDKVAGAQALKELHDALKTVEAKLGSVSADNPPISQDDVVTDLDDYDDEDAEKPASAGVVKDLKDAVEELESSKGQAGGLAELDETGKVPSDQLPSYVDDVIEGYMVDDNAEQEGSPIYNFYEPGEPEGVENKGNKIVGEKGKIYVDLATNKSYRWSGSTYIEISSNDMVEITAEEVEKIWEEVLASH